MDSGLSRKNGTSTRKLVHFVTQQTRFALINNILRECVAYGNAHQNWTQILQRLERKAAALRDDNS